MHLASAPAFPAAAPCSGLTPDANYETLSIPSFSLTNQDGETVDESIFDGQITIADFIFTNCPFICPPMTANMRYAQEQLAGANVRFASFSVDPTHDTPERLREFAGTHEADLETWAFLTGDFDAVSAIISEGLRLAPPTVNENVAIPLADGQTMANIAHPPHFVLIGPDREVITMVDGVNRMLVDGMIERAKVAAAELSMR